MQLEIICYAVRENVEILGYDCQDWLEIFFIDSSNVCSHMPIETQSLDAFFDFITELTIEEKPIGTAIVKAKAIEHSTDNGDYFSLSWESADNKPKRVKELQEFVEQKQPYCAPIKELLAEAPKLPESNS